MNRKLALAIIPLLLAACGSPQVVERVVTATPEPATATPAATATPQPTAEPTATPEPAHTWGMSITQAQRHFNSMGYQFEREGDMIADYSVGNGCALVGLVDEDGYNAGVLFLVEADFETCGDALAEYWRDAGVPASVGREFGQFLGDNAAQIASGEAAQGQSGGYGVLGALVDDGILFITWQIADTNING